MSAPSSRADGSDGIRLRRGVQAVYALQALSIALALLGDGVAVTALIMVLPSAAGLVLNRLQRDTARDTPIEPHVRWQMRSAWLALLWLAASTLVLGPLLFIGLSLLWFAYALIGLWFAWRIGRGAWSLLKTVPLPGDQPAVTRKGEDA